MLCTKIFNIAPLLILDINDSLYHIPIVLQLQKYDIYNFYSALVDYAMIIIRLFMECVSEVATLRCSTEHLLSIASVDASVTPAKLGFYLVSDESTVSFKVDK